MRGAKLALMGALLLSLTAASLPVVAASPGPAGQARLGGRIPSVGTRIDRSLPATAATGAGAASTGSLGWRPLDEGAYTRAKAAAATTAAARSATAARLAATLRRNDFSISASPASRSVVRGSGTTFAVSTAVTSGRAQTVTFSRSGLPSGATGTFSPKSVLAGHGSTFSITTSASTPTGTFTLTIKGSGSLSVSHSTTVSLTVTAPPPDDFSISATPATQTVVQGAGTSYTVNTLLTSGNAQTISLAVSGLPSGVTGTFSPASITAGGSATLTISAGASAATGTVTLTITGTGTAATHATTVSLTVSAAPPPDDFSISATPATQTVVQGAGTSYTVNTLLTSGNAQTISLSVTGLPSGVTGTFSPASITAGGSATLTISAGASAATGTVTLTITGTGTAATHATTVSLTVSAAPPPDDFSISATPATQTVVQGAGTSYTVNTLLTSGNAQTISLSVTGLPSGVTGTFSPASITAGGSATLTISAGASAATGTVTLTITGTGTAATHATTVSLTVTAASTSGPTIGSSWLGETQGGLAPPDPTGAIGPNSYIELINERYGIFGRDGSLIDNGELGALTGLPTTELSDPTVVWDPTAQRYYYLALDIYSSAFAFGYSKTADPRSSADFCKYIVNGFYSLYYLPDYPKLAVTQDFVLIGTNVFLLAAYYVGSDVDWFQKPTDPSCPGSLGAGSIFGNLKNANGTQTSTPEPAVAADPASGGWVVGSADVGTGSAGFLTVFHVTKDPSSGYAAISGPTAVNVATYSVPANAPELGASQLQDTMDTRLTHAVAGYDPRLGATAIWTAHTVFGGAGSEGRWYEINTAGTPSLAQAGRVTDANLYVWNGAVSPDRAADDATGLTGSAMVMGFNTSAATTYPALQMVSQRGLGAESAFVLVQQSPGPNVDFSCTGGSSLNVCRWGDYAGATPDPLVASGGRVWLSGEWNLAATDGYQPDWQTWNWSATP